MTYPCVNLDHFQMIDGEITPRHHMQFRHVATNLAPGINKSYPPTSGGPIDDTLHTVQTAWTNTTPINQKVYALLTRGGSQVVLQARSRAYLEQLVGTVVGTAPADPATTTSLSKFGIGFDSPIFDSKAPYFVLETRIGERTALLGTTVTVPPGQTYKARCAVRFFSDNWETLTVLGGNIELEARITSGATQIDLFAYPSL